MDEARKWEAGVAPSLLDAVLSSTNNAVVRLNLQHEVVDCNRAAERIFGIDGKAMLGRRIDRVITVQHRQPFEALLERAGAGETFATPDMTVRGAGLPVHGMLVISPVRDTSGVLVGSCLVVHDHTERLLAQETLALSDQRVRRSEALAKAGSFVLDALDKSEQWSEGMYRLFGVGPDDFEATRESHLEQVHPDDQAALSDLLDRALAGAVDEMDHRLMATETTRWVFCAVEPIHNGDQIVGVSGICQDITERKMAEQATQDALDSEKRANDQLRRLDSLKDEFLATVSHELRTPLTSIVGYSMLLQKQAAEWQELIAPITRNGQDMVRMVEKLLDYSRMEADDLPLHPEPLELAEHIDSHLAGLVNPDQSFVNEVPRDLTLTVDRDALDRILGNLIGNAAHYSGAGGVIRVEADEADGRVLISVLDNGPGIAAEHLDRLFDRFYRAPAAGAGRSRGSGLGLAIVRGYVQRQGGDVWCESTVGVGSTFVVSLPRQREAAE